MIRGNPEGVIPLPEWFNAALEQETESEVLRWA